MISQTTLQTGLSLALLGGVTACGMTLAPATGKDAGVKPEYLGIKTDLLGGNLVDFKVQMKGARGDADVLDYARCAAAQYALIRGYGFARHVRTNVTKKDGLWRADAVYTVSAALPKGLLTLDAEVVVENCKSDRIPTV